jgi:hypothetical protein
MECTTTSTNDSIVVTRPGGPDDEEEEDDMAVCDSAFHDCTALVTTPSSPLRGALHSMGTLDAACCCGLTQMLVQNSNSRTHAPFWSLSAACTSVAKEHVSSPSVAFIFFARRPFCAGWLAAASSA